MERIQRKERVAESMKDNGFRERKCGSGGSWKRMDKEKGTGGGSFRWNV